MRRFLINKSTGGGGGGISGSVFTFASLPPAADHTGELYYVQTSTGSIFTFDRKQAGIYVSDGTDWKFAAQYSETVNAVINNYNRLGAEDFDITLSYKKGEFVREGDDIYSALGAITPGVFNPFEWQLVQTGLRNFSYNQIDIGETITIPTNQQMLVHESITIDGTLVEDGELVILGDGFWTVELIDALTVDFYAPYPMSLDSVDNVLAAPTITILDDGVAYVLGTTIAVGSKITITADIASVVNINQTKL